VAFESTITGAVVACTARPYDFVPNGEAKAITGVSCTVFLVQSFDQAPVAVKVPKDLRPEFDTLAGQVFGQHVELAVVVFDKGPQLKAIAGIGAKAAA